MFANSFLLLAALVAGTLAIPTPDTSIVHEKRSGNHADKAARIRGDAVIPLRIALSQSNLDSAYSKLMDVSHPESADYGKHWTVEEVDATFAPSDSSVSTVKDWLIANGIAGDSMSTSRSGGWLAVDLPASQAELLLNTEFHEFESSKDGSIRIGCDSYNLPQHVAKHVDFIRPGVTLSPPMSKNTVKRSKFGRSEAIQKRQFRWRPEGPASSAFSNDTGLSHCGTSITPDCIKAMYGIPDATISAEQDPANYMGLYETGDVYAQKDLNAFFAKYAPQVPKGTHPTLNSVDGAAAPVGVTNSKNMGESDIDMDMIYSLIYPQAITLYQASTKYPSADDTYIWIDNFLDAIDGSFCNLAEKSQLQCGVYDLARVTSISYDSPEFAETAARQQRACNEIMKLGLQGKTVVVSSGDYGVASHPASDTNGCADASGDSEATNGDVFQPQFPATCPYVLAVGGTQLNANQTFRDSESVMNPPTKGLALGVGATFSSGGGFANYFDAPDYQSDALSGYFSSSDPGYAYYDSSNIGGNGGVYNRGGRGIPDVSANGAFFTTFNQGKQTKFYGTSLAAPLWGSLITLINEERCAAGKSPVGFINPALYQHPEVFTDIISGSNPGCNTEGFPAVAGWDPSTGLGTPKYQSLLDAMMSLP